MQVAIPLRKVRSLRVDAVLPGGQALLPLRKRRRQLSCRGLARLDRMLQGVELRHGLLKLSLEALLLGLHGLESLALLHKQNGDVVTTRSFLPDAMLCSSYSIRGLGQAAAVQQQRPDAWFERGLSIAFSIMLAT